MTLDELAECVAGARIAAKAKTSTAVDPYVVALAALANLAEDYFRTRYRYNVCGETEIHAASVALTAAESSLLDAVVPGRLAVSRFELALPRPESLRWWHRIWSWSRK